MSEGKSFLACTSESKDNLLNKSDALTCNHYSTTELYYTYVYSIALARVKLGNVMIYDAVMNGSRACRVLYLLTMQVRCVYEPADFSLSDVVSSPLHDEP